MLQLLYSAEHTSNDERSAALLCYQDGARVIFNRTTLLSLLDFPQYVLADVRYTL